ncbi:hypothetical protein BDN72DRAFT_334472 [Pluteus cervinus]|uniref:Uncharacterized protein n=1 Tax=Pluteus cervinus TaxID=181527 RepID=A0ACD3B3W5_9AGAR|nr:hypothetical protein BDN72DRAFT_334472 [Pluteus cervinus]
MLSSPSIRPTMPPLSFSGHQFILGVYCRRNCSLHLLHATHLLFIHTRQDPSFRPSRNWLFSIVFRVLRWTPSSSEWFFCSSAPSSPLARLPQVSHPDQHRPDVLLLGHQFTLGSLFLGSSIRNTASTSCCIIRNTPFPRSSTPMAFSSLSTRPGQCHRDFRPSGHSSFWVYTAPSTPSRFGSSTLPFRFKINFLLRCPQGVFQPRLRLVQSYALEFQLGHNIVV